MAGVSPTAVSFVINNKKGVSEKTRKRVKEVIERTNFQPNLNSMRLLLNKSFNISIVIRKTSSPFDDLFYLDVTKGLLEKSKEYGYNIVFTDISVEDGEVILPNIITHKDTDGIVFFQDTEDIVLREVNQLSIPYVIADSHIMENGNHKGLTTVSANYELSAHTAVCHLIDNGHRDIAYIGSSFVHNFYLSTFEGYRKALEKAQVTIQPSWMQINATDEDSACKCARSILGGKQRPTAIFCTTDTFAIGAMKCAKDMGLSIPKDISFIGIDDIFLANYVEPKLTTIKIDKFKIGSLAMELIMDKIEGKEVNSVVVDSDYLIVRDSVMSI
jgi:LacI family repressor for deo operon, udp, cdd, tsx, nupC, and nupG